MLIDADGAIEGSITGGCVESDVVANALDLLAGDGAPRMLSTASPTRPRTRSG